MGAYLLRRLLLLPLTLFAILLVNFVIINLAPGDPTSVTEVSEGGATRKAGNIAFGGDQRYLQFREHYGLTLPILFNTWPFMTYEEVLGKLEVLMRKHLKDTDVEISLKVYDALRIQLGDQARFIMPHLLKILSDPKLSLKLRALATRFFIRGGTRQAIVSPYLNVSEKAYNQKIAKDNLFLLKQTIEVNDSGENIQNKVNALTHWYHENQMVYNFEPSFPDKVKIFFFDTRFYRYFSKVLTLDFGTLRNDPNKTVINEVVSRFKYSLTLSIIPMLLTVMLCQIFGFWMAYKHNQWPDLAFNLVFLILYALPVFVVTPFLIEKVALHHTFFFTETPIPISGFTSPEQAYKKMTSFERFIDTFQHLILPFVAVMYGGLAAQTRLSRTAVLEVLRQDYVRTARAKGLSNWSIMTKHVGRNAAITIVTSVAGSLGAVLGGSLIVETLFDINGFGKFFYDAVVNRDYNVIMFSAIAGSFLTLVGYLVADILYMFLDPRVSLE